MAMFNSYVNVYQRICPLRLSSATPFPHGPNHVWIPDRIPHRIELWWLLTLQGCQVENNDGQDAPHWAAPMDMNVAAPRCGWPRYLTMINFYGISCHVHRYTKLQGGQWINSNLDGHQHVNSSWNFRLFRAEILRNWYIYIYIYIHIEQRRASNGLSGDQMLMW